MDIFFNGFAHSIKLNKCRLFFCVLRLQLTCCIHLKKPPPFCNYIFNYCSTINQVKNYTYNYNLFFVTRKYFLQLLSSNVKKYKLRVKLYSKMYATCQHHNNSHYMPLFTNLVENYPTNIVKGCCQLHSTNG